MYVTRKTQNERKKHEKEDNKYGFTFALSAFFLCFLRYLIFKLQ